VLVLLWYGIYVALGGSQRALFFTIPVNHSEIDLRHDNTGRLLWLMYWRQLYLHEILATLTISTDVDNRTETLNPSHLHPEKEKEIKL